MDGEWHDIDRSACVAGLCEDEALRARWARLHLARDAMKGESVLPDPALAGRIRAAIEQEPAYSNVVGFGAGQEQEQEQELRVPSVLPSPDAIAVHAPARPVAVASSVGSRWRQGAMGFGLAATVALATVAGLSMWQGAPGTDVSGAARVADAGQGTAVPLMVAGDQTVAPALLAPRLPQVELVGNVGSFWVSDAVDGGAVRSAGEARLNDFLARHLEQASSASREGLLPYSRLVGYDESSAGEQR